MLKRIYDKKVEDYESFLDPYFLNLLLFKCMLSKRNSKE